MLRAIMTREVGRGSTRRTFNWLIVTKKKSLVCHDNTYQVPIIGVRDRDLKTKKHALPAELRDHL